ncbi:TRAP transporter large permease subunit [Sulfitobacter sp. W074]|uniref:TRAP transporter large permease n=1 Tax=Sulfitobacter sp. W074 TaxID=2867026 RepID=UPI0021A31AB8|nr:TRAP transporter large permease subunit [Sulfitobacter sp. W074]UWR38409.1 TRAP transporter large permease subunit [Sulfitobacter sp. W074]
MIADLLPIIMFASVIVLIFTGYPVAFVLGGTATIFAILGMMLDRFNFIQFFSTVPRIWGGVAENLVMTAIPMFVLMGLILERSGVGRDLVTCMYMLMRRVPGGLAVAVALIGTVMAAATGIIGASITMLTVLTLPILLASGYSPKLATGTVAASGTLGILIPPSIMLVIMAELLGQSVADLFFAALIPGLMLASFYMAYVIIFALLSPKSAPTPKPVTNKATFAASSLVIGLGLFPPAFLIFLVLGSILFGWATPTEAAGVGAFGAILLALFYKPAVNFAYAKLGVSPDVLPGFGEDDAKAAAQSWFSRFWHTLDSSLEELCRMTGMLFLIIIAATSFSFVFRVLGGDHLIITFVEGIGLGSWGLLILIMVLSFVLGFFFDWLEISLIILPIFAPIIASLDFGDHLASWQISIWFLILMSINLQTSFLTPPFGFSLFFLKGAAPPSVKLRDIYLGIIPFVLIQLVCLTLVMMFPQIALWLPTKFL